MKIKMVQPGYEQFTGNFGGVEFLDGVSVVDVAPMIATRIANVVRVENVEDGVNPSASQTALDSYSTPMELRPQDVPAAKPQKYTAAELESIASKEGIKGLRKIGDTFGVKATGIAELIALILRAQTPGEQVEFLGEVPSDVVKAEAPAVAAAEPTPAAE
jgi:hypothetical protein